MVLDEPEIERLIDAAGYGPEAWVAVGVRLHAATLLVGRGTATEGFDCDSLAYSGSLTKQVTGACAALLVRDGALDIERPIATWLPELPAWARKIRVRHLIHHTAGLPPSPALWASMEEAGETDWTSDGVIASLSTVSELVCPPGAVYDYSNAGYICLARILERVTGEGLGTFAQRHLLHPAGMRASLLWSGPERHPPAARFPEPWRPPAALSLGDGGLWTTVSDLLRWNDALRADLFGISDDLHTTGTLDDGSPLDYASGVRVVGRGSDRLQSHGGSWGESAAKLVRLPGRGASLAALAPTGGAERMMALSSALEDALLE